MKKLLGILFILILFSTIISVKGQGVWAPSGATWHYQYDNQWWLGYVEIKYIGDSLVDGKMCKVLEKIRYQHNGIYFYYDTVYIGKEYTYLDSNIVYYYRHGQFYKLYDFNSIVSDTWEVAGWNDYYYYYPCDSIGELQVDSVNTFVINADTLKGMYVRHKDTSDWYIYGLIVERIGSLSYMFPEPNCMVDNYEGGALRCYYDSTFGLFKTSDIQCDYIIGIENINTVNKINIYPNPTTGKISVEAEEIERIEVMDLQGKEVYTDNEKEIDLSKNSKGIYIIKVTSKKGVAVQKIVLE